MLFNTKEFLLSGESRKFPSLGIFVIVQKPSGEWLYVQEEGQKKLPFRDFSGGASWKSLVRQFKTEWGLETLEEQLVGVGSGNVGDWGAEAYGVFLLRGVPTRTPQDHGWEQPETASRWNAISMEIMRNCLDHPSSVWSD